MSFVVPAHRNRDTLPDLVAQIRHIADQHRRVFEVVVVEDGCPDRCGDSVASLPDVRLLRVHHNVGQRNAVAIGIREARLDEICVLDADLQDDPADALRMSQHLEVSGVDVVAAGRRGVYQPAGRRLTGRLYRGVRYLVTGGRVPRDAGLFSVSRREAALRMIDRMRPGSDPLIAFAVSGSTIETIPVIRRTRSDGASSYTAAGRLMMGARGLTGVLSRRGDANRGSTAEEAE